MQHPVNMMFGVEFSKKWFRFCSVPVSAYRVPLRDFFHILGIADLLHSTVVASPSRLRYPTQFHAAATRLLRNFGA